ncbi:MAG: LysM peptidoglycan-binding domain-containing protein [Chloroflexi bacterium]|nr:MAG: LysM peptidoglycan-binding domain-containing protein [Chloroflexota bacterium]
MVSRRHLFSLLLFLTAISLVLVACERPTPRPDDADSGAVDTAVDTGAEAVIEDPNVGGGTDGSEPAEQPVSTDAEPSEAATDTQPAEETVDTQPAEETGETAVSDTTEQPAETTDAADTTETTETDGEETTTDAPAEETTATDTAQETGDQPTTHTVAAGENLYRIGLKYKVSWVALAQYNNLPNANRIYVGQILKLAPPGDTGGEPTPTPSPATETTYIVQPGDNLFRIGLKYGISWVQIAEANGLVNPNIIKVGDTLKIPVSTPGPSPQFTHLVQPGDTLFKISLQYGIPWPNIATANDIPAPYVIYPGQTLQIPGQ